MATRKKREGRKGGEGNDARRSNFFHECHTSDFRRDAKFFPGFVERELNWKLKKKGRKNPLFSFPPSSLLSRSIYSRFLGLIRAFDSTNFTAEIARSTRSVHRFRILDSVFLARVTDSTRVSPHFESDSISIGRVLLPFFLSPPPSLPPRVSVKLRINERFHGPGKTGEGNEGNYRLPSNGIPDTSFAETKLRNTIVTIASRDRA